MKDATLAFKQQQQQPNQSFFNLAGYCFFGP
jgi:hypothetical protein